MFSRKNTEVSTNQTNETHTQLLNCIYYLIRNLYFPDWNKDTLCTKKLVGMIGENNDENIVLLIDNYDSLFDTLERASLILLQDSTYPNRKLHFDCRRLNNLLSSVKETTFYPHSFMGYQLYANIKEEYPYFPESVICKCVGMLMEAHSVIGLFNLHTDVYYLRYELKRAMETLVLFFKENNYTEIEIFDKEYLYISQVEEGLLQLEEQIDIY